MKTTEEEKEEMACKGRAACPVIKGRLPTGREEEEEAHSRGHSRPHLRDASPGPGVARVVLSLLFVLVFTHQTKGELYNTTRLENVDDMNEKIIIICVRPLGPEVVLAARMYVQSTAIDKTYDAGNVTVEGMEENVWHNISLDYGKRDYVHILDATLDGESVPFNKPIKKMWTSSYKYNNVAFLVKGAVEITGCPPPEDPTTKIVTSTTTAPTTTADSSASAIITTGTAIAPITSTVKTSEKPSIALAATDRSTIAIATTDTGTPIITTTDTAILETMIDDVTVGNAESWIRMLGSVGSVPALPLIIGVAVLVIIFIVIALIACCSLKRKTTTARGTRHSTNLERNSIPMNPYTFDEGTTARVDYSLVPQDEMNGAGGYHRNNLTSFRNGY